MMLVAAKAWRLREEVRRSLEAGDFRRAHEFAMAAQKVHSTAQGDSLRLVSAWLGEVTRNF
ncbi:MAG: hypothetical protein WB676_25205 [Bryobacteraceae bacterium]